MEKRQRRGLLPSVLFPGGGDDFSVCVPCPLAAAERLERSDGVSEEAEKRQVLH